MCVNAKKIRRFFIRFDKKRARKKLLDFHLKSTTRNQNEKNFPLSLLDDKWVQIIEVISNLPQNLILTRKLPIRIKSLTEKNLQTSSYFLNKNEKIATRNLEWNRNVSIAEIKLKRIFSIYGLGSKFVI